MKKLIITEKPSLSNLVKSALYKENWSSYQGYSESDNYIVTNVFGHLLTLYDIDDYMNREKTAWSLDELPFVPEKYLYKVKNDDGIRKQLKLISTLIERKDVDKIIASGDPDDEGTALINLLLDYCFNKLNLKKEVLRLWATEQTEPSIREAMKNLRPNEEYDCYANKALARAASDFCIGINYSRALTLIPSTNGKNTLLPTGRVLGVIVLYIYNRYKEQLNFIPKKYFDIGLISNDGAELKLILKDLLFNEDEEYKALELINELNSSITSVKTINSERINKYPKRLFSLTTLQNKLSKEYKFSSKKTLSLTQSLYNKGYVTYPRAKSEYLPDSEKEKVKRILNEYKKEWNNIDFKDTKHIFDSNKVGTDHAALIPTVKIPNINELSKEEQIVYITIRNRFLANFCTDECIVDKMKLTIGNNKNNYVAEINGLKVIEKGFLSIENTINEKELPALQEGQVIDCTYNVNECYTKAPSNVSNIELNKYLESPFSKEDESEEERYKKMLSGLEIGTVATRASIIDNAKKYGYITEEKGLFKITAKGIYYIETSEKLGLSMTPLQTAKIGQYLQSVFDGKINSKQCVQVVEHEVVKKVNEAKKVKVNSYIEVKEEIGVCPICKNKKMYESTKWFYCEGFKDKSCDFIIGKQDKFLTSKGKTLTRSMLSKIITNGSVKVKLKRQDKSTYDANIQIVKNDKYYNIGFGEKIEIKKDEIKCPRCGKKIYEGDKNFYCEGYRDNPPCGYKVWKENKYLSEKGIKLTSNHIKNLIKGSKIKASDKEKKIHIQIALEDTGTYVNYKLSYINK